MNKLLLNSGIAFCLFIIGSFTLGRVTSSKPLAGKIAFASTRDKKLAIYTMNPNGSEIKLLHTKPDGAYYDMSFSNDQKKLVYAVPENLKNLQTLNFNIFVFDLKSSSKQRITNFQIGEGLMAVTPEISPNGKLVAFTLLKKGSDVASIYLVDVQTRKQKRLTLAIDGGNPQFDKTGEWICYVAGKRKQSEIYIIKIDGTQKKRLTHNAFLDMSPSFHPHGGGIVFSSIRNGDYQIITFDLKTGREQQLTSVGQNRSPSYSLDGNHITFVSARDGNDEIYIMDKDGKNQKRLTNNLARDLNPIWLN